MTRFPGLDHEDLATLRAHAREAGSTRTRRAANPFAAAATVVHVEHWPCAKGCGVMVGVPQEAATALAVMNAKLAVDRQSLIAKAKALPCDACKRKDDELEQARRRPHKQRKIPLDERPSAAKGRL